MNQNQAHSVKSPRTLLKIYGERNTGTNYLRQLININIDADLLSGVAPQRIKSIQRFVPGREFVKDVYFFLTFSKNLGWKHSLVRPVEQLERISLCSENLAFVTLTKNPYSWLLSLYKRPYPFHIHQTNKPDLESFLETKWPTLLREQGPRSYANPIQMWNQKNAAYLKLRERFPTFNATYEALLADPEKTVAEMVDELGLHRNQDRFQNVEQATKQKDDKKFENYQDYYLNERWKEKLSPAAIAIINRHLDQEVVLQFGYEQL